MNLSNSSASSKQGLKVIFAGTPEFAAQHLQALIDSHHSVCAVYTQPDRKAGRGRKLHPSPVKALAQTQDIPVFQPLSLKSEDAQQEMAAFNADIMVVVAYGIILPRAILDLPRLGCINVHASLLPRWRGAAPIQRAILAGDTKSGVCFMQMDEGLDTGAVLAVSTCPVSNRDTAHSLHNTLADLGSAQLASTLDKLAQNKLTAQVQGNAQACYAAKLSKAEAQLDWHQSAASLARQVRAFNPWPVAFTRLDEDVVRIWQARPVTLSEAEKRSSISGCILSADKKGILVACAEGGLCLETLQLPGGKALSAEQLLASRKERFKPGTQFQLNAEINNNTPV